MSELFPLGFVKDDLLWREAGGDMCLYDLLNYKAMLLSSMVAEGASSSEKLEVGRQRNSAIMRRQQQIGADPASAPPKQQ